jgi:hypothetical protein
MKIRFIIFFILCRFLLLSATESVRVVSTSDTKIILEISNPLPGVETARGEGALYSSISVQDDDFVQCEYLAIPCRSLLLHLDAQKASLRTDVISTEQISCPPPLPKPSDSVSESTPTNEIRYLGKLNGKALFKLTLFPYVYDYDANRLIIHTAMRILIFPQDLSVPNMRMTRLLPQDRQELERIKVLSLGDSRFMPVSQLNKKVNAPASRVKIEIEKDGWYKITGKDLLEAGIDIQVIDMHNLSLSDQGQNIPIYISGWRDGYFDPNDSFEFWGEFKRQTYQTTSPDLYQDPFCDINVYWLSWDDDAKNWMSEEQGSVLESQQRVMKRPYSFYQTVHIEEDNRHDNLKLIPPGLLRDHWFYDDGISAASKRDYPFKLWYPDDRSPLEVKVRVMMGSNTNVVQHDAAIYLNDQYTCSEQWTGHSYKSLQSEKNSILAGADLKNGENVLTILNQVEPLKTDIILLNWFEVTYPRLYRAHDNFIKFSIPPDYNLGHFLFKVDGFTSETIDIYKLGHSKITGAKLEEITDIEGFISNQVTFHDYVTSYQTEYIAIDRSGKYKPKAIYADQSINIKPLDMAADYLIITHDRFIDSEGLAELVHLRQSQGYTVLKVNVKDIYDEFNDGEPSPYAIKNYLQWAVTHWQSPRLKYVLFVGDGCRQRYRFYPDPLDPQVTLRDTLDFVPVFMTQTIDFGATASDFWYSLLDGENIIPDVALGRLPVRTLDECDRVTRKIVRYETEPPQGNWRSRFLFIGGNHSAFRTQCYDLAYSVTPADFEPRLLLTLQNPKLAYDPHFGSTFTLLDYFDQGCAVINFHGHGGGAIWADNGLLRIEDVEKLYGRNKLPLVMSMTCFTAAFESPKLMNLADTLLFSENVGAIAFLGSSGITRVYNDYYLQREILKVLYQHPDWSIGDIINTGKVNYQLNYQNQYVESEVHQYHILGDPATRLALPQNQVGLHSERKLYKPGETIQITATLPFEQGVAHVSLTDSFLQIIESNEIPVSSSDFSSSFTVPENFEGQNGWIRLYANDNMDMQRVNGGFSFSLSPVMFDSVFIDDSNHPKLRFRVYVEHEDPPTEVLCVVNYDTISMKSEGSFWYTAEHSVPLYFTSFSYEFIFGQGNKQFSSGQRIHSVQNNIDLTIDVATVDFDWDTTTYITANVLNLGNQSVQDVKILYEYYTTENEWKILGKDWIDIDAFSSARTRLPYAAMPGELSLRMTVDPENQFDMYRRYNNRVDKTLTVNAFPYNPHQGIVIDKAGMDTLRYDDNLTIFAPLQAVSSSSVLKVEKKDSIRIWEQPDLKKTADIAAYEIVLGKGDDLFSRPLTVYMDISEPPDAISGTTKTLHLYRFEPRTQKWVQQTTIIGERSAAGQIQQNGVYTLLYGTDDTPPTVKLTIDGQPVAENSMIAPEPYIAIQLQDMNGIDISPEKLTVYLDDKFYTGEELALPDSGVEGNHVHLTLRPKLRPGSHILFIQALDCMGNASPEIRSQFRVAAEFELTLYGNYPNPFQDETIFAYHLSMPCEQFSIKIYSASGRLIRTLDPDQDPFDPNPLGTDYHEAVWDGLDEDGFEVANGVYFYKAVAEFESKKYKVTGKIARIQ